MVVGVMVVVYTYVDVGADSANASELLAVAKPEIDADFPLLSDVLHVGAGCGKESG